MEIKPKILLEIIKMTPIPLIINTEEIKRIVNLRLSKIILSASN
jgi:hypothetical protein